MLSDPVFDQARPVVWAPLLSRSTRSVVLVWRSRRKTSLAVRVTGDQVGRVGVPGDEAAVGAHDRELVRLRAVVAAPAGDLVDSLGGVVLGGAHEDVGAGAVGVTRRDVGRVRGEHD